MLTHVFPSGCPANTIAFGDGTIIGDFTNTDAGNSESDGFDGVTSQGVNSSARTNNATTGFYGKDWGAGTTHKIVEADYYGPNDDGIQETTAGAVLRIQVQESSTGAWGGEEVTIGDTGLFDGSGAGTTKTITCTGGSQRRYHRFYLTGGNGSNKFACAEGVFKGC